MVSNFSHSFKYLHNVSLAFIYIFYQSSFDFSTDARTAFDIFLKNEKLLYVPDVSWRLLKALFTNNIVIQGDLNNYFYLFDSFSIFCGVIIYNS